MRNQLGAMEVDLPDNLYACWKARILALWMERPNA